MVFQKKHLAVLSLLTIMVVSACRDDKSKTSAQNTSTAAQNASAITVAPQKTIEKTSAPQNLAENELYFAGSVGDYPVEMRLSNEPVGSNQWRGSYFYIRHKKPLELRGTKTGDQFSLEERDAEGKITGRFKGEWRENASTLLIGEWIGGKKPLVFQLRSLAVRGLPKTISLRSEKITRDKGNFSLDLPQLTGKNTQALNEAITHIKTQKEAAYQEMVSNSEENNESSDMPASTLNTDYSVVYSGANPMYLVLEIESYAYNQGAAHGAHVAEYLNYDFDKQKVLSLEELFKPQTNYLDDLSRFSKVLLKEKQVDSDDDWLSRGTAADPENYEGWYLTKNGLGIYFGEYQVASYAAGPQYVIIPWENLKNKLNPDFKLPN